MNNEFVYLTLFTFRLKTPEAIFLLSSSVLDAASSISEFIDILSTIFTKWTTVVSNIRNLLFLFSSLSINSLGQPLLVASNRFLCKSIDVM